MQTQECLKCHFSFSLRGGNYGKHINKCVGLYPTHIKQECCRYCSKSFHGMSPSETGNHSRWCVNNPKHQIYKEQISGSTSKLRNGITKESRILQAEGIKKAHAAGKYKGASIKGAETRRKNGNNNHTEQTKELIREKALKSKHRRLVRSIRKYVRKDGTVVMLDSSWEEALAVRLDSINIKWVRPDTPIPYIGLDGRTHNYFPDFYLPDQDVFLDPKNPHALAVQKNKIDIIKKILNNLIIIETLDGCKNFGPVV